jgi:hypothetical protein
MQAGARTSDHPRRGVLDRPTFSLATMGSHPAGNLQELRAVQQAPALG